MATMSPPSWLGVCWAKQHNPKIETRSSERIFFISHLANRNVVYSTHPWMGAGPAFWSGFSFLFLAAKRRKNAAQRRKPWVQVGNELAPKGRKTSFVTAAVFGGCVLDMGVRSAAFDLGLRGSVALPAPRHPACFPPALAAVELCPRAERPTVGWIPSPQAWKAHASTVRPGPVGRRKLGNVPSVPEFVNFGLATT
jgi:hypothetical protein